MDDPQVQPIHDKTPKIAGLTPSRSVVVAVIAVIAVLVVTFSNVGTTSVNRKTTTAPATPSSPDQVRAFTAELQREATEYAKEKERAEALKTQALALAGQQNQVIPGPQVAAPVNYTAQPETKRRSNIAFTFRDGVQQVPGKPDTKEDQLSDIRGLIDAQKAALAANIATSERQTAPLPTPVATLAPTAATPAETFPSTGKTYKLFEGTIIETVLENRLNGSFTGPVKVLVTTTVYSHDRQHVVIPQGSEIIGEAERVGSQGQQRLAVVFHRVIMPDGATVHLDKFIGLDQAGETGLKDKTDNHWGQIITTAVALGIVQGFTLSGTGSALTSDGFGQYRQGLANSTGQAGTQVLSQKLNILPTITIREGHRVRVFLQRDIDLPAYENHRVPGDI